MCSICFCFIQHTVGLGWYELQPGGIRWYIYTCANGLCKCFDVDMPCTWYYICMWHRVLDVFSDLSNTLFLLALHYIIIFFSHCGSPILKAVHLVMTIFRILCIPYPLTNIMRMRYRQERQMNSLWHEVTWMICIANIMYIHCMVSVWCMCVQMAYILYEIPNTHNLCVTMCFCNLV